MALNILSPYIALHCSDTPLNIKCNSQHRVRVRPQELDIVIIMHFELVVLLLRNVCGDIPSEQ